MRAIPSQGAVAVFMALMAGVGRRFVIGVPMGFLLLVFALPFLVVFKISISEVDGVRFVDLLTWHDSAG